MKRSLALLAIVAAPLALLHGCDDKKPAPAAASASASAAPKPSSAPRPSAPPASTASAAPSSAPAAAAGKISIDALKKFKPPVPKGMEADYDWAENKNFMIEGSDGHDTEVRWDLVSKKDATKVAISLDIEDQTADVKSGSVIAKDDKYKTYPAKKGPDFIRVDIGNVQVQVEIKDKAAATMDTLTKTLDGLDAAGLEKL